MLPQKGCVHTKEEENDRKLLSNKCTVLYAKIHKIQRVIEIPWRGESQDWMYFSLFTSSDVFSQLFCSENKENVCFIIKLPVGDFSVLSYFYKKTILSL